jgi:glutathione S-transferase kappa 1
MRILTALKAESTPAIMEQAAEALWDALWFQNKNISKETVLAEVLANLPGGYEKWSKAANNYKDQLLSVTRYAVDCKSFGAPWWEVTNSDGEVEFWWGSDRYQYIFDFLGLEYKGVDPQADSQTRPRL